MAYLERDMRKLYRGIFGYDAIWIEPNHGSTFAVPDIFLLAPFTCITPIELKRFPDYKVTPDQTAMHRKFMRNGISSFFIFGPSDNLHIIVDCKPIIATHDPNDRDFPKQFGRILPPHQIRPFISRHVSWPRV